MSAAMANATAKNNMSAPPTIAVNTTPMQPITLPRDHSFLLYANSSKMLFLLDA